MSPTTDAPTRPAASSDAQELSLGQLLVSATRDISGLVRDEVALAKAELRDDVKAIARGSGMFAAAAVFALLVIIMLSGAFAYGLVALGLHPALAFLIVAGTYLLICGILALIGIKQVKKVSPPERTIETTKESVAALRGEA